MPIDSGQSNAADATNGSVELEQVLCGIGLDEDGQLCIMWSSGGVAQLRCQLSPDQLINAVEALESGFSRFIGALCGGRH